LDKLSTSALSGPNGEQLQAEFWDLGFYMPAAVRSPGQAVVYKNPLREVRLSVVDERGLLFAIDGKAQRDALDVARDALMREAQRRLREHDYQPDGRYTLA